MWIHACEHRCLQRQKRVSGLELEAIVSHLTWMLGSELIGEQVL